MRFFSLLTVVATLLGAVSAATLPVKHEPKCAHEEVVSTTYIGKDKNVKLQLSHCDDELLVDAHGNLVTTLTKRQSSNVCGAPCNTYCWSSATGAPTISDCTVIEHALLYESQNTGVLFNVSAYGTPTNKVTMQYLTCLTYFLNQDFNTLTYCRTEWSKLVNWLASDCSAANNDHGGLCVATDQRWYVQVQHS
ncbi:hypothetical protein L226DRAFT_615771 [Lentinus tigrinus ALCF2SS1-7]|uniref:Cyanovirin-N domain-containing protein n=1 Tax=Lentinus tigrinus ALCF2SS1-6 TaxID=1328759 RepID=A0A5C2RYX1_9APHY|nr:hypothetical protein L227DRAFT_614654 [Lentinus tigrinus ALCF2SS1-6]RPD71036.1 hypothetical protein L226DRAFT_615771 [Lentinus tigrinus ALCF2SS1-7]